MKSFNYIITDPVGIHARPAGLLAKEAKQFADAQITITKDGNTVKASQLMMLMSLGIKQGDEITVSAQGPGEDAAIAKMEEFFKANL